jgi:hypothetical protein
MNTGSPPDGRNLAGKIKQAAKTRHVDLPD